MDRKKYIIVPKDIKREVPLIPANEFWGKKMQKEEAIVEKNQHRKKDSRG